MPPFHAAQNEVHGRLVAPPDKFASIDFLLVNVDAIVLNVERLAVAHLTVKSVFVFWASVTVRATIEHNVSL